jgi:DNA processing protein
VSKLNLEQLTNLYTLLSIEGVGPAKVRSLLAKFRKTEKILSADYDSLLKVDGISSNLAKRIHSSNRNYQNTKDWLEGELSKLEKLNAEIITVWDDSYPKILKNIYDPPLILQIKGGLLEVDDYSIAMVGTRMPTNYGKVQAERIATGLAEQNITVVSGMARGIDSISHSAALKQGGRTISIIGSGLDVIYPPENHKLFDKISESGAVVSEFNLGTKPDAVNFPKRNRIISGISLGSIIVETGIAGGAMQTARFALDQNREVFAELKLKPVLGKNIPRQQEELNLFEEKILNALNSEALMIDNIANSTNLSTSDCLVHLLSLEFKGLVKQLPGKMFALL